MNNPIVKHLVAIVRIALGAIFLYAAVLKIPDTAAFAGSIAAFLVLPYFGNYLVAAVLPWLELFCGILLVTGWRARPAAMLIALLNLFFIVALAAAMARGLDVDCGCFGKGKNGPPLLAIGRDLLFLAMAMLVIWQESRRVPE